MEKKTIAKFGMIVGVLIVIFGILIAVGVLGAETVPPYDSGSYKTGFASFGADFYTYASNNAYLAGVASNRTVNNLCRIRDFLGLVFGVGFISFGLFMLCHFGLVLSGISSEKASLSASPSQYSSIIKKDAGSPVDSGAVSSQNEAPQAGSV